ncbi:MAG: glycosyltransferase family 9 protein [Desulfarculaceae bacterium]|jgi:ADP-heptose:LPS heptosyltransferase
MTENSKANNVPEGKSRALALSTTALGDTLLSCPAMESLTRHFRLDVIVHQRQYSLVENLPGIQGVFTYRNNGLHRAWLGLRLGRRPYKYLVVLHSNNDILKLLPRLKYQKAANLQGWQDESLRLEALPRDTSRHMLLNRLELVRWTGAEAIDRPMRVYLHSRELAQGRSWLRQKSLLSSKGLVAICPGAADSYKQWPAKNFGSLARNLMGQGFTVVQIGAGNEAGLLRQVQEFAGQSMPAAMGVDLRLLAAILANVNLLITNDTGPMHLAQAVDTPVLALFGPTDPNYLGPRQKPHRILSVHLDCEPCLTRECQNPVCMEQLALEDVEQSALEMLGRD